MILVRILCCGWLCCVAELVHATCLANLPAQALDSRYQIQGETVVDQHTGLMWQRCALGQVWSPEKKRCQLDLELQRLFTWSEAVTLAQATAFAGHGDWRLPNKNELSSLLDRACTGPALNETAFPDTPLGGFWTSTPARHTSNFAWHIDFTVGTLVAFDMDKRFAVRLVRQP